SASACMSGGRGGVTVGAMFGPGARRTQFALAADAAMGAAVDSAPTASRATGDTAVAITPAAKPTTIAAMLVGWSMRFLSRPSDTGRQLSRAIAVPSNKIKASVQIDMRA